MEQIKPPESQKTQKKLAFQLSQAKTPQQSRASVPGKCKKVDVNRIPLVGRVR